MKTRNLLNFFCHALDMPSSAFIVSLVQSRKAIVTGSTGKAVGNTQMKVKKVREWVVVN